MRAHQQKIAVATLAVATNSILVISKFTIGWLIGSVAVISESIHSGIDLLAAGIALFAVWMVKHPADVKHPFGHGKIENISGAVEALLIFLAAAWIVIEAVRDLINPQPIALTNWGAGLMLFSAVVNSIVARLLFVVGRKTQSVALQADGWHLLTDVYTSLGVMFALLTIWIGNILWPQAYLGWIDPIAAIAVALFICRAGWHVLIHSGRDLLDAAWPSDEMDWIQNFLNDLQPTIHGFHNLRTRRAGADRFMEVHLTVSADMTIAESHKIIRTITQAINARYPGTIVTLHVEPACAGAGQHCPTDNISD